MANQCRHMCHFIATSYITYMYHLHNNNIPNMCSFDLRVWDKKYMPNTCQFSNMYQNIPKYMPKIYRIHAKNVQVRAYTS